MAGEWLAEIEGVKGVRSSFVFDAAGQVIAGSPSTDSENDSIRTASRKLAQAVAALTRVVGGVSELDVACERARVVVRDPGIGLLGVVCEPGVDIAMLRLMLNVAVTRMREDADLRRRLERVTPPGDVLDDLDEISRYLLQALAGKEVWCA